MSLPKNQIILMSLPASQMQLSALNSNYTTALYPDFVFNGISAGAPVPKGQIFGHYKEASCNAVVMENRSNAEIKEPMKAETKIILTYQWCSSIT